MRVLYYLLSRVDEYEEIADPFELPLLRAHNP
jgi:hypothetical protein